MKRVVLSLFLVFSIAFNAFSSSNDLNNQNSLWVKLAKGKALFNKQEYGQALGVFRSCLAKESISEYSLPLNLYLTNYEDIIDRIEKKRDIEFFKNCYIESSRKNFYVLYRNLRIEDKIQISNILRDINYVPNVPEAYYWMARIYEIEGEFSLAEMNYKIAIDQMMSLEIMDSIYELYYRLIDLYIKTDKENDFLNTITTLLEFDPLHSNEKDKKNVEDYLSSLDKLGFDKTVELYRITNDKFIKAYSQYAKFYIEKNKLEEAKKYLFLNVLTITSIVIENLTKSDYYFKYENVEKSFEEALSYKYIKDFILSSNLFENMYNLGKIYKKNGNDKMARYFFWLVIRFDVNGHWKELANEEWVLD